MEKSIDIFEKTIDKMEKTIDFFEKTIDKMEKTIDKMEKTIDKLGKSIDFLSFSTGFLTCSTDFRLRMIHNIDQKVLLRRKVCCLPQFSNREWALGNRPFGLWALGRDRRVSDRGRAFGFGLWALGFGSEIADSASEGITSFQLPTPTSNF